MWAEEMQHCKRAIYIVLKVYFYRDINTLHSSAYICPSEADQDSALLEPIQSKVKNQINLNFEKLQTKIWSGPKSFDWTKPFP